MNEFAIRLIDVPAANAGISVRRVARRHHVNASLNYKRQRDLVRRVASASRDHVKRPVVATLRFVNTSYYATQSNIIEHLVNNLYTFGNRNLF